VRAGASPRPTVEELEKRLTHPALQETFNESEFEGLPSPVRRYLSGAIAAGTPLSRSARIRTRGSIKLGRWLPFRARQVENPREGFVWAARVAGLIGGYDFYADGRGAMRWKVLGLFSVADAESPDHARSAAGRAGAESIWVPTAMLPRFGVEWSAQDDHHISSRHLVDGVEVRINYLLDDNARIRSMTSARWGDPDGTGNHRLLPTGLEVTGYATFDGVTVPSGGRYGWFYGSDRWSEGEFFRFEITGLQLVGRNP
jgi:hypothetical protein